METIAFLVTLYGGVSILASAMITFPDAYEFFKKTEAK